MEHADLFIAGLLVQTTSASREGLPPLGLVRSSQMSVTNHGSFEPLLSTCILRSSRRKDQAALVRCRSISTRSKLGKHQLPRSARLLSWRCTTLVRTEAHSWEIVASRFAISWPNMQSLSCYCRPVVRVAHVSLSFQLLVLSTNDNISY